MNSDICSDWLMELDTKMCREGRNVLMFMDNFSAHRAAVDMVNLTNIRIEFLPPNCTSLIHPVDQGVGNTLKQWFSTGVPRAILRGSGDFSGIFILILSREWIKG